MYVCIRIFANVTFLVCSFLWIISVRFTLVCRRRGKHREGPYSLARVHPFPRSPLTSPPPLQGRFFHHITMGDFFLFFFILNYTTTGAI